MVASYSPARVIFSETSCNELRRDLLDSWNGDDIKEVQLWSGEKKDEVHAAVDRPRGESNTAAGLSAYHTKLHLMRSNVLHLPAIDRVQVRVSVF